MIKLGNDWDKILGDEFEKEYYIKLRSFLIEEYKTKVIYPKANDIYNSLRITSFDQVKVVILGQDPYHQPGQAHGLSFSVVKGTTIPPSLRNIYKELRDDLGIEPPDHGCLNSWAERGVLLLNTVLTVEAGKANSHKGKGWEILTNRIIQELNNRGKPVVFILWGANASAKKELITNGHHLILEGVHPSPLSAHRGFWGGKYFSRANDFLEEPVDWQIS